MDRFLFPREGDGGDSHKKRRGCLPFHLGVFNCRFWSHLKRSGRKANINILTYTVTAESRAWRNNYVQLFRERLWEKVHATIPKGIVGGFGFIVLRKNLKEWHDRPWTYVCEC